MKREKPNGAFNLFFLADRAVIPTSGKPPSRYTVSIEPVQVFDWHDKAALAAAIEKQLAIGIPQIPELNDKELIFDQDGQPNGLKNPVEPNYAGVSTWDELERKSIYFSVQRFPSGYLVDSWKRAADGKWSEEQSLELRLPASVGVSGLVDAIWAHLQTRKDLPGVVTDINQPKTARGA